jgi:hypothetical protein
MRRKGDGCPFDCRSFARSMRMLQFFDEIALRLPRPSCHRGPEAGGSCAISRGFPGARARVSSHRRWGSSLSRKLPACLLRRSLSRLLPRLTLRKGENAAQPRATIAQLAVFFPVRHQTRLLATPWIAEPSKAPWIGNTSRNPLWTTPVHLQNSPRSSQHVSFSRAAPSIADSAPRPSCTARFANSKLSLCVLLARPRIESPQHCASWRLTGMSTL